MISSDLLLRASKLPLCKANVLDLLLEYICGQDCILFCIFEVLIFYHIEMAYVKVYHSRNLFASLNLDPKTEGPEICAEQVSGPSAFPLWRTDAWALGVPFA